MLIVIFAMLHLKVFIDLRRVKVIRSDQGDVKRKNAFLLSSFKLYINLESRRQCTAVGRISTGDSNNYMFSWTLYWTEYF